MPRKIIYIRKPRSGSNFRTPALASGASVRTIFPNG